MAKKKEQTPEEQPVHVPQHSRNPESGKLERRNENGKLESLNPQTNEWEEEKDETETKKEATL